MIQFIRFPEFTEFPLYLGTTPLITIPVLTLYPLQVFRLTLSNTKVELSMVLALPDP